MRRACACSDASRKFGHPRGPVHAPTPPARAGDTNEDDPTTTLKCAAAAVHARTTSVTGARQPLPLDCAVEVSGCLALSGNARNAAAYSLPQRLSACRPRE